MQKNKSLKAVSFGEILFDVFEKEKKIGKTLIEDRKSVV